MIRSSRSSLWKIWAKWPLLSVPWAAARQREAMQDVYGAWEELQQLRSKDQELFINDQELNARYLDLTTKGKHAGEFAE